MPNTFQNTQNYNPTLPHESVDHQWLSTMHEEVPRPMFHIQVFMQL